ncbi:MAG: response regulator [Anaerolineae bacterium]|nr:response regulator [Anaerolineae bacterium]
MGDKQQKILVVDDLSDWRATLRGMLREEGYEVHVADSSSSALALLESDSFDLALLDVRLDETDEDNAEGLSLASEISHRWPTVKIAIITGYGTQETIKLAMEPDLHGQKLATEFIFKTQTSDLVRIVQEVLSK